MIQGRFVSIKLKFMMIAMLLVTISSAMWGWWAWQDERDLLYHNLKSEGEQLVTSLASPIINALLYEEMGVIEEGGLLDNFIEEIINNPSLSITSAFVTDHNGKVLAHNRYGEYGKVYTGPLITAALNRSECISQLEESEGLSSQVLEIAMPLRIHGKRWGVLQVVISTVKLHKDLHSLALRIILTSLSFFVLGTFASYLIGRSMALPLQKLSALMSSVTNENLVAELPPDRSDEIGQLQNNFSQMLERLRSSEEERQRMVAQLIQSEKMASIGKIVAGVAHEVNNPLATIGTCIYNLEQENISPNRNLEIIKQGAERIRRIVSQLNDFSRAGSIDLQPIASNRFFSESAEFAKIALSKYAVRLVAQDECNTPCPLCLDKGKMQQVILNLLINASDASQPGAVVGFKAYCKDFFYHIEVTDNGCGINEEDLNRIFDIFYTTKKAGKGTGIGLAICKSIVEMHGGDIRVVSHSGETVFSVVIPQNNPEVCSAGIQASTG
jgi:two-component system NtrC family sensor kinase